MKKETHLAFSKHLSKEVSRLEQFTDALGVPCGNIKRANDYGGGFHELKLSDQTMTLKLYLHKITYFRITLPRCWHDAAFTVVRQQLQPQHPHSFKNHTPVKSPRTSEGAKPWLGCANRVPFC